MQKVTVTEKPMNVNSGLVELDAEQYRRRQHAVRPVEGREGVYEIRRPIQFKVGETFGHETPEQLGPGKNTSQPVTDQGGGQEPKEAAGSTEQTQTAGAGKPTETAPASTSQGGGQGGGRKTKKKPGG